MARISENSSRILHEKVALDSSVNYYYQTIIKTHRFKNFLKNE